MGHAEPYCQCPSPPTTKLVSVYQCPVCHKNRNDAPPISDFTIQQLHELWMSKPAFIMPTDPVEIRALNDRIRDPKQFAPLLLFIWPRIEWELAAARIQGYVEGYRDAQTAAQQLLKGEDND